VKNFKMFVVFVVLTFGLAVSITGIIFSCHPDAKPFAELTSKEKLAYIYQIYNAQHEDYMRMAANPNLTESQKIVLRNKKPILVTLQTLIPAYDQQVQTGSPTKVSEQQIYNLLTQLQGYVIQLE